jgi:hypothetical protein
VQKFEGSRDLPTFGRECSCTGTPASRAACSSGSPLLPNSAASAPLRYTHTAGSTVDGSACSKALSISPIGAECTATTMSSLGRAVALPSPMVCCSSVATAFARGAGKPAPATPATPAAAEPPASVSSPASLPLEGIGEGIVKFLEAAACPISPMLCRLSGKPSAYADSSSWWPSAARKVADSRLAASHCEARCCRWRCLVATRVGTAGGSGPKQRQWPPRRCTSHVRRDSANEKLTLMPCRHSTQPPGWRDGLCDNPCHVECVRCASA